jgi:hypothetical protein
MTSRIRTLLISAVAAVALLFVAFPNVVIQPYTAQNPLALKISLAMLQYQGVVELVCCIIAAVIVFRKRSRWTIAAAATVFLCAIASRIDIYERLFHPLGKPSFQSIAEAKLDGDEHLLAVNLGASRAYPIRTIAYHHIVNDVIGGVPIAVTY